MPRIKAQVVAFDGATLTVKPDGENETMKIGVRPATRILKQDPVALAALAPDSFTGATLAKGPGGAFNAQEVHVFPENLRGSGEGLYPASPGSSRFILNGTVTGATTTTISLKFRGLSGEGAQCTGRAPTDPLQGCQGAATIAVPPGTPVLALSAGDKSLIKPGAILALSIMAGPDGRPVTPGLTVESVATPPVPMPEAPASASPAPAKPVARSARKP